MRGKTTYKTETSIKKKKKHTKMTFHSKQCQRITMPVGVNDPCVFSHFSSIDSLLTWDHQHQTFPTDIKCWTLLKCWPVANHNSTCVAGNLHKTYRILCFIKNMKNIYFISCHFFFYNKTVNTNMRAITDYEFNKHTQNNGKNQINISQCNKKR